MALRGREAVEVVKQGPADIMGRRADKDDRNPGGEASSGPPKSKPVGVSTRSSRLASDGLTPNRGSHGSPGSAVDAGEQQKAGSGSSDGAPAKERQSLKGKARRFADIPGQVESSARAQQAAGKGKPPVVHHRDNDKKEIPSGPAPGLDGLPSRAGQATRAAAGVAGTSLGTSLGNRPDAADKAGILHELAGDGDNVMELALIPAEAQRRVGHVAVDRQRPLRDFGAKEWVQVEVGVSAEVSGSQDGTAAQALRGLQASRDGEAEHQESDGQQGTTPLEAMRSEDDVAALLSTLAETACSAEPQIDREKPEPLDYGERVRQPSKMAVLGNGRGGGRGRGRSGRGLSLDPRRLAEVAAPVGEFRGVPGGEADLEDFEKATLQLQSGDAEESFEDALEALDDPQTLPVDGDEDDDERGGGEAFEGRVEKVARGSSGAGPPLCPEGWSWSVPAASHQASGFWSDVEYTKTSTGFRASTHSELAEHFVAEEGLTKAQSQEKVVAEFPRVPATDGRSLRDIRRRRRGGNAGAAQPAAAAPQFDIFSKINTSLRMAGPGEDGDQDGAGTPGAGKRRPSVAGSLEGSHDSKRKKVTAVMVEAGREPGASSRSPTSPAGDPFQRQGVSGQAGVTGAHRVIRGVQNQKPTQAARALKAARGQPSGTEGLSTLKQQLKQIRGQTTVDQEAQQLEPEILDFFRNKRDTWHETSRAQLSTYFWSLRSMRSTRRTEEFRKTLASHSITMEEMERWPDELLQVLAVVLTERHRIQHLRRKELVKAISQSDLWYESLRRPKPNGEGDGAQNEADRGPGDGSRNEGAGSATPTEKAERKNARHAEASTAEGGAGPGLKAQEPGPNGVEGRAVRSSKLAARAAWREGASVKEALWSKAVAAEKTGTPLGQLIGGLLAGNGVDRGQGQGQGQGREQGDTLGKRQREEGEDEVPGQGHKALGLGRRLMKAKEAARMAGMTGNRGRGRGRPPGRKPVVGSRAYKPDTAELAAEEGREEEAAAGDAGGAGEAEEEVQEGVEAVGGRKSSKAEIGEDEGGPKDVREEAAPGRRGVSAPAEVDLSQDSEDESEGLPISMTARQMDPRKKGVLDALAWERQQAAHRSFGRGQQQQLRPPLQQRRVPPHSTQQAPIWPYSAYGQMLQSRSQPHGQSPSFLDDARADFEPAMSRYLMGSSFTGLGSRPNPSAPPVLPPPSPSFEAAAPQRPVPRLQLPPSSPILGPSGTPTTYHRFLSTSKPLAHQPFPPFGGVRQVGPRQGVPSVALRVLHMAVKSEEEMQDLMERAALASAAKEGVFADLAEVVKEEAVGESGPGPHDADASAPPPDAVAVPVPVSVSAPGLAAPSTPEVHQNTAATGGVPCAAPSTTAAAAGGGLPPISRALAAVSQNKDVASTMGASISGQQGTGGVPVAAQSSAPQAVPVPVVQAPAEQAPAALASVAAVSVPEKGGPVRSPGAAKPPTQVPGLGAPGGTQPAAAPPPAAFPNPAIRGKPLSGLSFVTRRPVTSLHSPPQRPQQQQQQPVQAAPLLQAPQPLQASQLAQPAQQLQPAQLLQAPQILQATQLMLSAQQLQPARRLQAVQPLQATQPMQPAQPLQAAQSMKVPQAPPQVPSQATVVSQAKQPAQAGTVPMDVHGQRPAVPPSQSQEETTKPPLPLQQLGVSPSPTLQPVPPQAVPMDVDTVPGQPGPGVRPEVAKEASPAFGVTQYPAQAGKEQAANASAGQALPTAGGALVLHATEKEGLGVGAEAEKAAGPFNDAEGGKQEGGGSVEAGGSGAGEGEKIGEVGSEGWSIGAGEHRWREGSVANDAFSVAALAWQMEMRNRPDEEDDEELSPRGEGSTGSEGEEGDEEGGRGRGGRASVTDVPVMPAGPTWRDPATGAGGLAEDAEEALVEEAMQESAEGIRHLQEEGLRRIEAEVGIAASAARELETAWSAVREAEEALLRARERSREVEGRWHKGNRRQQSLLVLDAEIRRTTRECLQELRRHTLLDLRLKGASVVPAQLAGAGDGTYGAGALPPVAGPPVARRMQLLDACAASYRRYVQLWEKLQGLCRVEGERQRERERESSWDFGVRYPGEQGGAHGAAHYPGEQEGGHGAHQEEEDRDEDDEGTHSEDTAE